MTASKIGFEFCSQHPWAGVLANSPSTPSSAHLWHRLGLHWGHDLPLVVNPENIQISWALPRYPEDLKFEFSLGYVSSCLNKLAHKQKATKPNKQKQKMKYEEGVSNSPWIFPGNNKLKLLLEALILVDIRDSIQADYNLLSAKPIVLGS